MKRLHEAWEDDDGVTVFCAGPRPDLARRSLSPSAKLLRTFEAGSHLEAMTIHYRLMGWGEYKIEPELEALVKEPYAEEE